MKKIFIFIILLLNFCASGQSSIVLEPNGNNGIISKNASTVNSIIGSVPIPVSGAGTRLMWIPAKSAFRVGTVYGPFWDADSIGTWSFATGVNAVSTGTASGAFGDGVLSSGYGSHAFGVNLMASADYAIAMGYSCRATKPSSFAVGYGAWATGDAAIAIGTNCSSTGYHSMAFGSETTSSGIYSFAIGNSNTASGNYSTALGSQNSSIGNFTTTLGAALTAQSYVSVVAGRYNIISGSNNSWVNTDPLLVIGNGSSIYNPNNALTLLKNSNLGLNTATPQYQLSFKDDLGDKISFYYGNTSNTTNHYGIGVQAAKFQLFTPSDDDDLVFGYGRSAAFTENVRFKGSGLVGIGVNDPSEFLDVNGRMRVRHRPGNTAGVWMSNDVNSTAVGDGAFYGLKSNTEAGIFIGGAWRFGITNSGNMTVGGTVTASCGVLVCSDLRYKKNITSLNNSLDNILKINGVRYDFKKEEFIERNFSDKNQIGFIAQEIERILPEMVFTDEKGYKSVDYARLTPVLVEAMKEQQKMIDDLRKANVDLKNVNDRLESRLDKIEVMLNK
jgi:Chaperone of endosialidase/Head domain of trimeric autotransporter adhesin